MPDPEKESFVSLSSVAARGIAVTLVGQMARFLIQTVAIVVLARLIAPEQFGLFVMVASMAGLAAVIGDFGLSSAAIQAKHISQMEKSNLFWINSLFGLVVGAIFFMAAPMIASFYEQVQVQALAQAMCLIFVISGLAVQHKAELTRNMKFKVLTYIEIGSQFVGLVVALVLALNGMGVWALVMQQIASAITGSGLAWVCSKWLPGLPSRSTSVRSYLYFGANTMGGALTNYLSSNVDSVMLGRFAGAESVGIYGRMFQLFSLPLQQLATPLTRVALPVLSSIQDDQQRYLRYMKLASKCISYVFLAGFTAIIICSPYLVPLVLGDGWASGVLVLQILAIGGVFQGLGYVYYWGFLSRAKTNVMFHLSLVSRSLMVLGIVVASPYGMYMVAAAMSTGLLMNWLINTIWGLPAINISRKAIMGQIWTPLVIFLPFLLSAYLAVNSGLLELLSPVLAIVVILLTELVYIFLIALVIQPVRRDFKLLLGVARISVTRKR